MLTVICVFFTVLTSLGFYFENKMHAELSWRPRDPVLLFNEAKRLSRVNWQDVGMNAALSLALSLKIAGSPIWQRFRFEMTKQGEPQTCR